jgi:lysozyme
MTPSMTYSQTGFEMTKSFEGLCLTAYQDSGGVWTIGYGHTGPDVIAGRTVTYAEADAFLTQDLADSVSCVNWAVAQTINQNQFDALVDFTFNAGRGAFLKSTLLRMVNLLDFSAASAQFPLWVHAGGDVVPGLVRRRAAEQMLFNTAMDVKS